MNWNSSRDSKDLSETFLTRTWINNDSIISNTSLTRKENRGTNHTKMGISKAERVGIAMYMSYLQSY